MRNYNTELKDNKGRTALYHAARKNRPLVVKLLLENGADKSIKDNNGVTALNLAKKLNYKEVQEKLL